MEYLELSIPPSKEPIPADKDLEIATVNKILDTLEENNFDSKKCNLDDLSNITPWVSFQLGCVSQLIAEKNDLKTAYEISLVSIASATKIFDVDRICANMLTLAGIFIRLGNIGEAIKCYYTILGIPYDGGMNERYMAHLSLATLLDPERYTREKIHHYEKALPQITKYIPSNHLDNFLEDLANLYIQTQDTPGIMFCLSELNKIDENKIYNILEKEFHNSEFIFYTVTRLHSLGKHDIANNLHNLWLKSREK